MLPIPWETLAQVGGMSAVSMVLLWTVIQDRLERGKDIRCISVTIIAFQQMLLVQTFVRRGEHADVQGSDECKRLLAAVDELHRILETQRVELERMNAK